MSIGCLIMCSPLSNGAYWVTIFNMGEFPLQAGCSSACYLRSMMPIGEVLNPSFHVKMYVIPLVKCKLLL